MSIIKWKKNNGLFPTFASISENFFGNENGQILSWLEEPKTPAVNVKETDESYSLEVAAPGMSKEDFKLEVDKGIMTVSSETKDEQEEVTDNYTRKEFSYSSFKRSLWLPENVKEDEISAVYKDGILSITVPKATRMKVETAKEIEIA